jgi:uncharacterized membrane protein YeaQ/YmgE (transglycosylase-associated protein family)
MLDIIFGVVASIGARKIATGIARTFGASETVAAVVGGVVANIVGAELNTHHDSQSHHNDPHRG